MKKLLVVFVVIILGVRFCHNQHMMHKYKPGTYHKTMSAQAE